MMQSGTFLVPNIHAESSQPKHPWPDNTPNNPVSIVLKTSWEKIKKHFPLFSQCLLVYRKQQRPFKVQFTCQSATYFFNYEIWSFGKELTQRIMVLID